MFKKIDNSEYNVEFCKSLSFDDFDLLHSQFIGKKTREHYEIIQKLEPENYGNDSEYVGTIPNGRTDDDSVSSDERELAHDDIGTTGATDGTKRNRR